MGLKETTGVRGLQTSAWGRGGAGLLVMVTLWLAVGAAAFGRETRVVPFVAVKQEYDDNIFYSVDEEKTDDVLTLFSSGADLSDRSERVEVSAGAELEWKDHRENPDLDGLDSQFDASVTNRLTEKSTVSLSAEYAITSDRDRDFEESGIVDDTGGVERVVRTSMIGELSCDHALSEVTTAGMSYNYSRSDFDDSEFADYFSHTAGLGLERNISGFLPKARADIRFNYLRYESHFPGTEENADPDLVVDSYSAMSGLSFGLNEKLAMALHIGGRYTDSKTTARNQANEEANRDNGQWGGLGSLILRYEGEHTNCDFSLTQDLKPRSDTGGMVNNTASVFSLSHRFTETIRVGLAGGYYYSRSENVPSPDEVDEYSMSISPNVEYAVSKHILFQGSYSFRSVEDNKRDTETERNLFMIRVSFSYPIEK